MKAALFFLMAITLMSCGHFHDEPTKSVWSGYLWIAPWTTGILAVIFWVLGIRSYISGSSQDKRSPSGGSIEYSDQRVKPTKVNYFVFAVIFTIATIGIIIWVNSAR